MNRTNIRGSITVEAIVMLGLIATMTPILYKHVAERREDIENINEANTLLLLKNAVGEYIEANKETLSTGTLDPADIGIDISGYQIGIRKDSSGKIDAMITGTGGNDLKAGKIAALLGVSAGIYSAQNTAKAWGINGVWAEDISNYGFSSLPTGIPVITTAYDKEDSSGLNEEQLKDFIENTTFDKVTAKQFCLKENCISEWADSTYEAIPTIINCNSGDPKACKNGFQKGINTSCEAISETYKANSSEAQTGFYTLTTSETAFLYKQPCVFQNGEIASYPEVIIQCNSNSEAACRYGYNKTLNRDCATLLTHYPAGAGKNNTITAATSVSQQCCQCTAKCEDIDFSQVDEYECKEVNGKAWVRSSIIKTYPEAHTFCLNLGMELKSRSQLEAARLWCKSSNDYMGGCVTRNITNPFTQNQWYWTTDTYIASGTTYYSLVSLGSFAQISEPRANGLGYYFGIGGRMHWYSYYALCGPK